MADLRGRCGLSGTRPADCDQAHPCCTVHARENPDQPCISCAAGRALAAAPANHYARKARDAERGRR